MPHRTPLPLEALVFLADEPAGLRIGRARRNGDGIEQTDYDNRQWKAWEAQAYVRQLNEYRGITQDAAACMLAGGLHGWDSPEFCELVGDDPARHETDCFGDEGAFA